MRGTLRWLIVLMTAVSILGACGKKGDPIPPNPEDSTFPQTYPQR